MFADKGVFIKAKKEKQGEVKAVFSLLKPMWILCVGSVSPRTDLSDSSMKYTKDTCILLNIFDKYYET